LNDAHIGWLMLGWLLAFWAGFDVQRRVTGWWQARRAKA
jgi:hypothetical protein